jgi:hypothetical protein
LWRINKTSCGKTKQMFAQFNKFKEFYSHNSKVSFSTILALSIAQAFSGWKK